MRVILGTFVITLLYPLLLVTSLIARTMAVISAITANLIVMTIFWTKSDKMITYVINKLGMSNNYTKETK